MKTFLIILFLISFYSIAEAQLLKIGFRYEPSILITEEDNSSSTVFSPLSAYLTVALEPIENLSFEFRPGYIIGSEYYGGFESGAYVRWMILSSKYYLVGGINNHSNDMLGSHNGGSGYQKSILYNGIGIGYKNDSRLNIDVMYYWTNDKVFAYSRLHENVDNYRFTDTKMNGIIKAGISLTWDVL